MEGISTNEFLLFAIASLMLNITPGNDMIYIATRSINRGIRAGIISALGIALGCMVHIAASVFGLSAVILRSALLFDIVKYAGASYLIYLGIRALFSRPAEYRETGDVPTGNGKILFQGMITNVLNPKVALFFLAFLPQFIDPDAGNVSVQLTVLGIWFNVSGTTVNILVAVLLGKTGNLLARCPSFWKIQSKVTGGIFCALGIRLALASKS